MRFKPGLVLKICTVLSVFLFFVIFFKDSDNPNPGEEYLSHGQKRQLKNDSKAVNEIQTQKSPESLDLAEESDSLAGKRIDGLPNVTETRR